MALLLSPPSRGTVLLLLLPLLCPPQAWAQSEGESQPELIIETLVKPDSCSETSTWGDTLHIHYTGKLEEDGRVIDSSLSRDPLVVELGKKQVIPGMEQSLLDVCAGERRRVVIPPHLAYGKRGFPPAIPVAVDGKAPRRSPRTAGVWKCGWPSCTPAEQEESRILVKKGTEAVFMFPSCLLATAIFVKGGEVGEFN